VSESPFTHDNVLFRFFRVTNSIRQLVARAVEGTGLSNDEYGVFSGIVNRGPISPTELASILGVPPTTISVYLGRFLERGLVRRLSNPADGRSYLVEVTDEGRRLVMEIGPRLRAEAEALTAESELSYDELMTALGALEAAGRKALDADTTNV
jgi:MarR family transcriptional regulator, 2-MHQ and catechol-resistance regulon repressor